MGPRHLLLPPGSLRSQGVLSLSLQRAVYRCSVTNNATKAPCLQELLHEESLDEPPVLSRGCLMGDWVAVANPSP